MPPCCEIKPVLHAAMIRKQVYTLICLFKMAASFRTT